MLVRQHVMVGQLVEGVDRLGSDGDAEDGQEAAAVGGRDGEDTDQPEAQEHTQAVAGEPWVNEKNY